MFGGKVYKKIECADGFTMSVQARDGCYCDPREDVGPYLAVEVGYPSEVESLLMHWVEDVECPTDTVYGWVPAEVIRQVIAKHAGMVAGECPPLVGGSPTRNRKYDEFTDEELEIREALRLEEK